MHTRSGPQEFQDPDEIPKRYEKWKDIVRLSGSQGLRLIKGLHDGTLRGDRTGHRSSRRRRDLFGVAPRLAGVSSDSLPDDSYHDFVAQASFLLQDHGRCLREPAYFWWGSQLMACRMREQELHVKVILPQSTHMFIDMATVQDVGLAP